jgi:hypothetical protein
LVAKSGPSVNFFPIGWSQLNAVFEHGFAYARSMAFYDTTLIFPVTCCSAWRQC